MSMEGTVATLKESAFVGHNAVQGFIPGEAVIVLEDLTEKRGGLTLRIAPLYTFLSSARSSPYKMGLAGWCGEKDLDNVGTAGIELCELYNLLVNRKGGK